MSFRKIFFAAMSLLVSAEALAQAPKPNWRKVEADNGSIIQIDLNSIRPFANGKEAIIYIDQGTQDIRNMRRVYFNCQGHMTDISGGGMPQAAYVPPRSIGGRLSDIACGGRFTAQELRFASCVRELGKEQCAKIFDQSRGR